MDFPGCRLSNTPLLVGATFTAAGGGITGDNTGVASNLQCAEMSVVDHSVCTEEYGANSLGVDQFCVLGTDPVKKSSICGGDSGGPACDKGTPNIIHGVHISGSSAGCQNGDPTGHTDTSNDRIKAYAKSFGVVYV